MTEIIIKGVNKYYGINHVLKGLCLDINKNEKVGLLGKNGSGKTTVFKILTGEENYESGSVNIIKGKTLEILDQIPEYPIEYNTIDVINTAFEELHSILEMMNEFELRMQYENDEKLLKKYGKLQMEFENLGGYVIESTIDKICNGLGIDIEMRKKKFDLLSGGEKTRINLARILLKDPDILLLDEPTNHLDISTVQWLEEYVCQYKGTIIVISHDRYFLDKTVNRIIEIKDGKAEFYQGNYSYYIKEKELRYVNQLNLFKQQQRKIKQLEEAAKRLHDWGNRADNKSLHIKAFNIEKRIEKMDKVEKPKKDKKIIGKFTKKGIGSKEIISLNDVSKKYGDRLLWENINLNVYKDEKIAILGKNGTGKTTLLKLITGEEKSDTGNVKMSNNIKYLYMQQNIKFDDPNLTILETLRYSMEVNEENARRILAKFHFIGEDILKKISSLSGGEKSRLRLCILMQNKLDLLILDEPTNHLDIASREWIENAVEEFKGTIIFVSHDRYFVNKFATRFWEIDNEIYDFYGSYNEYMEWKKSNINENNVQNVKKPNSKKNKKNPERNSDLQAKKELEIEIEEMEKEIVNIDIEIEKSVTDYKKLEELIKGKDNVNKKLDILYEKWMEF
ncbi:MAG: ribosomal protection-like ABC-F family protein [Clostridiales bacterium]